MPTAHTVLGMKMPKQIELLTKERVTILHEPWMFKISGVTGYGKSLSETAHIFFDKLKEWAEREGSEVNLIQDRFSEIYKELPLKQRVKAATRNKGQSYGYLKVEITDPCARIIELIIKGEV